MEPYTFDLSHDYCEHNYCDELAWKGIKHTDHDGYELLEYYCELHALDRLEELNNQSLG